MKYYITQILIAIITILTPIQTAIFAIGFLIFADLLMGIISAYKNAIPITSKKLKNTGVKLLVYNILLISGFIAQTYLVAWIPFVNITLAFLAIVEIYSIGENFQKITGLPFIKYLKTHIDKHLNNETNNDKKDK